MEKLALKVSRTINANPEEVYKAWTEPEQMKQWYAPPGLTTPDAAFEAHEGGKYHLNMRSPEGQDLIVAGKVIELIPNQKIVFTWQWQGQEEESQVTVELEELEDGKTEVTLTHQNFSSQESVDNHTDGWKGTLEKLATHLEIEK
jgi:uncharacterized protein YndB with AHSA1/START domain